MDTLKKEIAILRQCSDFKEIEKQLPGIVPNSYSGSFGFGA